MAQALPNMHVKRYTHMTMIKDNRLYVFGGRGYGKDEGGLLKLCEYFDLDS